MLLSIDDFVIRISDISWLHFELFVGFIQYTCHITIIGHNVCSVCSIILYPFINGLISTTASKQQVSPSTSNAIELFVIRRVRQV